MAKVKLKVSMIWDGHFYRYGTVMEENEIPLSLRKPSYLGDPAEKDPDESVTEEVEVDDILTEEFPPPAVRRIGPPKR